VSELSNAFEQVASIQPEDSGNGIPLTSFGLDRRRTLRNEVQIPLFVYGHTSEGEPFYEDTSTVAVNAHGGLISMQAAVELGQRLLMTNRVNDRMQACIVIHASERADGGWNVAFSFTAAIASFWRASLTVR